MYVCSVRISYYVLYVYIYTYCVDALYVTLISIILLMVQIASHADSDPMDMNCLDIAIPGLCIITIHVKACGGSDGHVDYTIDTLYYVV